MHVVINFNNTVIFSFINSTVNIIGRASMHEWLGRKTPQIQIIDMEFCNDKMADF